MFVSPLFSRFYHMYTKSDVGMAFIVCAVAVAVTAAATAAADVIHC